LNVSGESLVVISTTVDDATIGSKYKDAHAA
jgi:hypothetical protein